MKESKLESKILYIVVFMLLMILLILIFGMHISIDGIGGFDKQLDRIAKTTTILGVLITLITILIAMKNLKSGINQLEEMKTQRVHSQEPDLFVESESLTVQYDDENVVFDSSWSSKGIDYNKDNLLPISVTNIGNGVAKYVTLTVYFELDFLQKIERLDKGQTFNVRILYARDIHEIDLFQYEYRTDTRNSLHNYDLRTKKTVQFNYIKSGETVNFFMDYDFMQVLNLALYLGGKVKSDEYIIPRVKADISYYDSFDNEYKKDVDIYIGSTKRTHTFTSNKNLVEFELNALNRLPEKQIKDKL